jgi:purine-binding chemotaxis protein CheW
MKGEKPFTAATNNKAGFVQAGVTHDNFSETIALTPQQKRRILEQRAHALAQSHTQDSEQVETLQIVEFALGSQHYAVETSDVREVQHVTSITPIPCTPSFVLGVINVRGRILSVIDLLDFFYLPPTRASQNDAVIVLGIEELEVGVLTEGILGARAVPVPEFHAIPSGFSGIPDAYVRGLTKEQLLLLDIERILLDKRMLIGADEAEF